MRRLTLILSDLYLPEEAGATGAIPHSQALPSLEWLLRFAETPRRIADWRHWLLGEVGRGPAEHTLAALASLRVAEPESGFSLLATPVHLDARIDHVRLADRGLLRLDADERAAWCEAFARVFGPQYTLREFNERAFLLSGVAPTEALTSDPARVLGAEVGPALPPSDAVELRRLWSEIEMWLHAEPLNAARERVRRARISALWLWGTAKLPAGQPEGRDAPGLYGGDPLIESLSPGTHARKATRIDELDTRADHVVVELAPLTGGEAESLATLESNWFAPARALLSQPGIDCVEVVANDRVFRTRPRASWKFWRRRRGWLESLA